MCIGIKANKELIGNLMIYIANYCGVLYQTKLLKLLYLIDERAVERTGVPITWLEYEAWEMGLVTKDVYYSKNAYENKFDKYVSFKRTEDNKYRVIPVKEFDNGEFTAQELEIIDEVLRDYGKKKADALVSLTHKPGSLWSKTVKENNIHFNSTNHVSDAVLDFKEIISGDNSKLTAYYSAMESIIYRKELI